MTDAAPETNAAATAQEPATNHNVPPLPVDTSAPQSNAEAPNGAGGASSVEQPTAGSADAAQAGAGAGEQGNVDASVADASIAAGAAVQSEAARAGDAPNVASGAVDSSPIGAASATNAAGAATSSPIGGSLDADLPLHVRVAHHLEAIFQLTKTHVEAPARSLSQEAVELKAHITDALHKLHNGMAVAEGALVQKLEAILRLL